MTEFEKIIRWDIFKAENRVRGYHPSPYDVLTEYIVILQNRITLLEKRLDHNTSL